ncbi:putative naringenin-chalcone synthase [Rhizorhapis suberifaciens]|uniref:Putative naringenin-chalcone synthase n=1 Tax=Rhizorhapis suberifaciens TaxID=13656 RepID=A0A840HTD5_9SPHN|nr:putative naringenin-chalcone synthase [Rhizorhapis suberifaciens]
MASDTERMLFRRMARRSGISHRWSILPKPGGTGSPIDPGGFYAGDPFPPTSARMNLYGRAAPELAIQAVQNLPEPVGGITHLVVASCTGFVAPGVDQIIARQLGLSASVERLLVGYMGCYAAVAALRSARHIVRSDPEAQVLVICVELSSLHLQPYESLETLLAALQFGDGAAAALVTSEPRGFRIDAPFALTLPDSGELIQWHIGDQGFSMYLSGEVPGRIAASLATPEIRSVICPFGAAEEEGWAVHAGGRSILDAVAHGLELNDHALDDSRAVLDAFGNMSSATLMFVLARMLEGEPPESGVALAFGPGLAAEGFRFSRP